MLTPPPLIRGSFFRSDEIERVRVNHTLLSVSLLLSNACNLRCMYCYRDAGAQDTQLFILKEWKEVLTQVKALGARNVWIPGSGEPMLDPVFYYAGNFPLIELANSLGLSVTFFTNGTLLTKQLVRLIKQYDVSVITKLNSFNPAVQDYLAGKSNVFEKVWRGLTLLIEAGFADNHSSRLGIDTVIVAQNYDEIPEMFKFCRDRNIIPYITANLHGGRACMNNQLDVSKNKLSVLFEQLLRIDQEEYGFTWFPSPPIVASQCKKLFYDIVVDSTGEVSLCPGIQLPIGNIRDNKLKDLMQASDLFQKIRNLPNKLEGKCRSCLSTECGYGCRLEAWAHGNLFGDDPMCWHEINTTTVAVQ